MSHGDYRSHPSGEHYRMGGSTKLPRGRFKRTDFTGPLTTKERKSLPDADFAIPSRRAYPIDTPARARNALARVSANGTPEEKRMVCEAVHKHYPEIHEKSCPMHG